MKQGTNRGEIARTVLTTIGLAGIVAVGVIAPNILSILPRRYLRAHSKQALERSLERLKRRGLLRFVRGKRGWRLELTEKGQAEFLAFETRQKLIEPPWRWDKKWRLLIFDIAEERKRVREKVRKTLVFLGFCRLQDSVWVYPYECEDVLELLRIRYGIRHEALYICAERIAKDRRLREHFGLS